MQRANDERSHLSSFPSLTYICCAARLSTLKTQRTKEVVTIASLTPWIRVVVRLTGMLGQNVSAFCEIRLALLETDTDVRENLPESRARANILVFYLYGTGADRWAASGASRLTQSPLLSLLSGANVSLPFRAD
ncbi:hypothetical protein JR316_0013169 [Psilocybe cubensis]|uniref:Uncharacterized protein n=1 Tax=Psilocybe cubensis TaxID=181762 RepID=A0ACB8GGT9_PSICU|nr:hypothetical protein JR316_0013169 [Psilocybe cubensis]KAH9474704.1 hypothetical protein JR316_0013169 [Psilocybe cubensis]